MSNTQEVLRGRRRITSSKNSLKSNSRVPLKVCLRFSRGLDSRRFSSCPFCSGFTSWDPDRDKLHRRLVVGTGAFASAGTTGVVSDRRMDSRRRLSAGSSCSGASLRGDAKDCVSPSPVGLSWSTTSTGPATALRMASSCSCRSSVSGSSSNKHRARILVCLGCSPSMLKAPSTSSSNCMVSNSKAVMRSFLLESIFSKTAVSVCTASRLMLFSISPSEVAATTSQRTPTNMLSRVKLEIKIYRIKTQNNTGADPGPSRSS
mmetsp:Transcript_85796/g.229509  ORF Transcript_85796/g.229509 Transcript_85796/m.229509 type:complete len:261 (+) Transcript_85796:1068-1850(+)